MGVAEPLPVLIASSSPAYARGLTELLQEADIPSTCARTIDAAIRYAEGHGLDVVIVDDRLTDGPGDELLEELSERGIAHAPLRVRRDDELVDRSDGRDGVILMGWSGDLIADAVLQAMRHRGRGSSMGTVSSLHVDLTPQERVVLRLMRQHLTYKEIATHLGVSWHTVRTHAQSILRKTGVHSRRDLVDWMATSRSGRAA